MNEIGHRSTLIFLCSSVLISVQFTDEVDCPFSYPDFATFWRGTTAAGPFQHILSLVTEEQLKLALHDAVEAFRLDDGRILIQPDHFKYVAAAR